MSEPPTIKAAYLLAGQAFTASDAGFESWWLGYYGPPGDYVDGDEYWTRKAFAYQGFAAGWALL